MSPATGQPSRTALARRLRKNSTDAERALWRQLRAARLNGHKFRRQAPIGRYVVDFVCFETRLVVEVDGGQHAEQQRRDAQRTAWLEAQGFRVLRFWNNEVLGNMTGVKEVIARVCAGESPSPRPSPTRGEGETTPLRERVSTKSPPPSVGEGLGWGASASGCPPANRWPPRPTFPLTPALSRQGRGRNPARSRGEGTIWCVGRKML